MLLERCPPIRLASLVAVFLTSSVAPANEKAEDIAFVQFHCSHVKSKDWKPGSYFATVSFPEKDSATVAIRLGDAAQVDAEVAKLRQSIQTSREAILKHGERLAFRALEGQLKSLYGMLIKPIENKIGSRKHWILIPDRELWLVPFAALVDHNGKFLIEQKQLTYLTAPSDVSQYNTPAKARFNGEVLFGSPDFGPPPQGQTPLFEPLPHTIPEVLEIARRFKQMDPEGKKNLDPIVLLEDKATRSALQGIHGPRILWLATHGYALSEEAASLELAKTLDLKANTFTASRMKIGMLASLKNPWSRCGLALASANKEGLSPIANAKDKGVITGAEIAGLDLFGTELVVLSACRTGVGSDPVGEAVLGLRKAFLFAGARSVVATLWDIPDRASAQLMVKFVEHHLRGVAKGEALCQAQREMIASRRNQHDAAHPVFWAAFCLTGQWD